MRAIIFDLDGTLVESFPLCIESVRRTVAEMTGCVLTDAEVKASFGTNEWGMFAKLMPAVETEVIKPVYLRHYEALHEALSPELFPWAKSLLLDCRAKGLRVGLVTGKCEESARVSLAVYGVADVFESVGTGAKERVNKDDKIREMLGAWGVPVCDALYVGDAVTDVLACRSIGVPIAGAAWAESTDAGVLAGAHPDYLFRSPDELRVFLGL